MRVWYSALTLAWTLLTWIPLPRAAFVLPIPAQAQSLSVVFYPWVGLFLWLLMYLLGTVLPSSWPDYFAALLLLVVWVTLTGALHLDGLADCCDGLAASHQHPQKIQQAIQDPSCGPMAVVGLILVLALKMAALTLLWQQQQWPVALLLSVLCGRAVLLPFMLFTPYAGSGQLVPHQDLGNHRGGILVSLMAAISLAFAVLLVYTSVFFSVILLGTLCAVVLLWRHLWLRRINGYVGDCLGALIELTELAVLLIWALALC